MLKLGLIVLASATVCFGQSLFGDKCTLWPIRGPEVSANKDCSYGNVWWDYPSGNLSVKFEQNGPSTSFEVCLSSEGAAYLIDGIYDESNGANVPIPTEGSPSCVNSVDGKVILCFRASDTLYYMALMPYKISHS
ncbi:uncharacterized protein LOC135467610 [Liolophura sinensis]|uniref:uncharacterized protein LOC135467610 n=1 Tax=Liolophura sinensis TaxID=3198878 RepID=UPI003158BA7F